MLGEGGVFSVAVKVFPQKEKDVGMDPLPGQPGQGICCCAGVPQPVQSCPVVANGAVLKESFDAEVQSWLCSSQSVGNSCPSAGFKRKQ